MSDPRVLVLYASWHGHTRRVAVRLAGHLRDDGVAAVLADADRAPDPLPLEDLHGAVVVASVHFGGHARRLKKLLRHCREELAGLPTALVSVSGAAMSPRTEDRAEAREAVERLFGETGWTPDRTLMLGGRLAYTRYNPVLRRVMRSIAEGEGWPTDTSRDHAMTDWGSLGRFARDFVGLVRHHAGATADHPEGRTVFHPGAWTAVDRVSTVLSPSVNSRIRG